MTWLEALQDEPFVCITDMLRRFAKERSEHPAVICCGEVVTYAALDARVDHFAAALQRDGIQPRDAIALCATASVDYAVAFLGGLRPGAAIAPLAPSSSAAWQDAAAFGADRGRRAGDRASRGCGEGR